MEFVFPELLSRDDILRILNQRQLQMQNMNELTHEELLRVYKTFVMPLSRRPERSRRIKQHTNISSINKCVEYEEEMLVEPVVNTTCTPMDVDFSHLTAHNGDRLRNTNRMISPIGEKRRQSDIDIDEDKSEERENDYQFQLSSDTKRIRINTFL